ncbi:MAG: hypothetical protein V1835_06860 [Candidatus Micrarchaeota archaeon]
MPNDRFRLKILWRMLRHGHIGGRHTAIENLRKGFAKNDYPLIEVAISDLTKEGFLIIKPTSYGKQVSLNPAKLDEVKTILGNQIF